MEAAQYVIKAVMRKDVRNGCNPGTNYEVYDLKIDVNGNVIVYKGFQGGAYANVSPSTEYLSIIDNIRVPEYISSMYKHIITKLSFVEGNSIEIFLEIVKILKTNVKENIENPLRITDLPTQLECAYKKIDLFEENYAKMEKKLKQINENYIVSLQDVNNLQDENIKLKHRIKELEKSKEQIIYTETPIIVEKIKEKIIYVTRCIDSDSDSDDEDEESSTNIQITSTSEV